MAVGVGDADCRVGVSAAAAGGDAPQSANGSLAAMATGIVTLGAGKSAVRKGLGAMTGAAVSGAAVGGAVEGAKKSKLGAAGAEVLGGVAEADAKGSNANGSLAGAAGRVGTKSLSPKGSKLSAGLATDLAVPALGCEGQ